MQYYGYNHNSPQEKNIAVTTALAVPFPQKGKIHDSSD